MTEKKRYIRQTVYDLYAGGQFRATQFKPVQLLEGKLGNAVAVVPCYNL
jgi:hypothetical protein